MTNPKVPFRGDHVGSLQRPQSLPAAREEFKAGKISAEDLREREDAAISGAVKMQEDVGLQSITDGEYRRENCHFHFLDKVGGFEPLRIVPKGGPKIVLGLLTTKRGEMEPRDEILRRIEEASKYVDIDQLCLSTHCGFSSNAIGNLISVEDQDAKLPKYRRDRGRRIGLRRPHALWM